MPVARIYDAAGHTTDFLYETDEPEFESAGASRLLFSAEILSGPHAGKTATIQWLGSFDLGQGVGSVREWRESIANRLHFSLLLDAPVDLDDLFDGMEDAFSGGFEFHGNRFRNLLEGDLGHDRLFGNAGNDRLFGYLGNDLLDGGTGADRMSGGRGNDSYVVDNRGDLVIESAAAGTDTVRSSINYSLPANVENLTLTGSAHISGTGNTLANVIRGNTGNNLLRGGGGNDSLIGGGGKDRLEGGAGNDRLVGGAGDDVLVGGAGKGNDVLEGGLGDDQLSDGYGKNSLSGGPGNDKLAGGAGRDTLTGGTGADQFIFGTVEAAGMGTTRDVITDFQTGLDKIVLEYIDANANRPNDQAFRFIGSTSFSGNAGEVAYINGRVLGDVDGDGVEDFQITIQNGAVLAAGDFIL